MKGSLWTLTAENFLGTIELKIPLILALAFLYLFY